MDLHKSATCLAFLLLSACASAPSTVPATASAMRDDPDCLRETGSRIPPRPGHCISGPGRSYDRDDIQSTGAPTLAEALHRLHPR